MKIAFNHDEAVAAFVAARLPGFSVHPGMFTGIGVTDDNENAVAGVVFHDFFPQYRTCQVSMAADTPMWARPEVITRILTYPFEELGVWKLWTATPSPKGENAADNRVIRFLKHLGFTQEAILADQFGPDVHAVICRMRKPDFEKLDTRFRTNGQRRTGSTGGT